MRSRSTVGFIEPCLPSPAKIPPAGAEWIHEIKHDGFRLMARRDRSGARLITRKGNDFSARFPQVVAAVAALPVRSCLLDGEAIVSDESGLAVFELLRSWRHDDAVVFCAFDLIELDGEDLRRLPIEQRKRTLAKLVRGLRPGMVFNEHYVGDGNIIYRHACKLGWRGDCIETAGIAVPLRPLAALAEGQEPHRRYLARYTITSAGVSRLFQWHVPAASP